MSFTRIVNPCISEVHDGMYRHTFCKITIENGELSISGVIGPKPNGNAFGACGQINSSLRDSRNELKSDWTPAMFDRFLIVWDEWHLNRMKPYTVKMKSAGWKELAQKEIFKFRFQMTSENFREADKIKKRVIEAARQGRNEKLTDREIRLLNCKFQTELYSYEEPEAPEFMELSGGVLKKPVKEKTTLGWVRPEEHPDGMLGKELDGEGYGNKWYKHELPKNVIDFLTSLPETSINPAWV